MALAMLLIARNENEKLKIKTVFEGLKVWLR